MGNHKIVQNYLFSSVLLFAILNFCICEELLELACENSLQCKEFLHVGVNVSCVHGNCFCSSGTPMERINCKPKESKLNNIIGGNCPCTQPEAECNKEQDVCYCSPNYEASADRRRCLKKTVALDDECETDAQCVRGDVYAFCNKTQLRCGCGTGFAAYDGACKAIMSPAFCFNNTQCQILDKSAFCADGICLCSTGYVNDANQTDCIEASQYLHPCTKATQCLQHLGPGAVCRDEVCHCDDIHYPMQVLLPNGTDMIVCKQIPAIGSYCHDDRDCYQANLPDTEQTMSCFYGECNCKHGFNSINNGKCMRGNSGLRLPIFNVFVTLALGWSALCLGLLYISQV